MINSEDNLINLDIKSIREQVPILKDIISFNSGMDGPLPESTYKAINKSLEKQYKLGTYTPVGIKTFYSELAEVKNTIASSFFCSPSNICLTPNTTFGINIALNGFNWSSSDEIITTNEEHPGVFFPLYNLKERYKTNIKIIEIDYEDPLKSISKHISEKTKAIVLSHISYESGNLIKDLKEIIEFLNSKGIISIIDGAQAAGAIELNLNDLNPDFYSAPGQKWLMGPCGTGWLYINNKFFNKRPPWPSVSGFNSALFSNTERLYDLDFNWKPNNDASLFEFGGLNNSLFYGLSESLNFSKKHLEQFDIYKRINQLANYLIKRLKENKNLTVITSNHYGGLVSWKHANISSKDLTNKLWLENKIVIREIQGLNICRASTHYFNTKDEIDLLIKNIP